MVTVFLSVVADPHFLPESDYSSRSSALHESIGAEMHNKWVAASMHRLKADESRRNVGVYPRLPHFIALIAVIIRP